MTPFFLYRHRTSGPRFTGLQRVQDFFLSFGSMFPPSPFSGRAKPSLIPAAMASAIFLLSISQADTSDSDFLRFFSGKRAVLFASPLAECWNFFYRPDCLPPRAGFCLRPLKQTITALRDLLHLENFLDGMDSLSPSTLSSSL